MGQEKDIDTIIAKERNKFLQYVRLKITNISEMDAEDIVAEVIFNVYNKVNFQHPIENIVAYMYRSVRNKVIDFLRQPKTVSLDIADEQTGRSVSENIPDIAADVELIVRQKELHSLLYTALLQLEPKQRAVWVATELEGYSFRELSEKWEEPIGTLLSRKNRAAKRLQYLLKDQL